MKYKSGLRPATPRKKINLKKVENFRLRKVTVNPPAFTTHFTTNSPQKHHAEQHVFSKTPAKMTVHHARKKYTKIIPAIRGLTAGAARISR
jgi:hypothetical protein